ncbi:uncharacterized protein AMSG_10407 [Thecamonas trahens ATCC 50062]|uniref:non-specific serine/threonine protein kinase n=1 Tax=Thecamonas trahens ATCC 50062 TaxID=461836 RepID=A0A0L0DQI1_THETB|nr:hypothetical protein AMSG_10407 [Thecamonas trahens ATCC 50062]KNC54557.1 hypothetical protein AMSG_10407 [Thecamonas trahens ATCC 50062]|eukprot:XP_013753572.1 hypothetical protein AMSG_10407 [Thecamonas trahens ATCC 50062]
MMGSMAAASSASGPSPSSSSSSSPPPSPSPSLPHTLLPGLDGASLFSYTHGTGLSKLPFAAPRLVQETPFVDSNDLMYLGSRAATIYAVDLETLAVSRVGSAASAAGTSAADSGARSLFVAVETMTISVVDAHTGLPYSNVSLGTISPSLDLASLASLGTDLPPLTLDALLADATRPIIYTDLSGLLHCIDRSTGYVLWSVELPATVVSSFYLSPAVGAVLRLTPLNKLGVHCLRDQCYTGSFALVSPSTATGTTPSSHLVAPADTSGLVLVGGSPASGLWADDNGAFVRFADGDGAGSIDTGSLFDDLNGEPSPPHSGSGGGLVPYSPDGFHCAPDSPSFPGCLTGAWQTAPSSPATSAGELGPGFPSLPGEGDNAMPYNATAADLVLALVRKAPTQLAVAAAALLLLLVVLAARTVQNRSLPLQPQPDTLAPLTATDYTDEPDSASSMGSSLLASIYARTNSNNSSGAAGSSVPSAVVDAWNGQDELVQVGGSEATTWRIGDITFDTDAVLGKGSHGTVVFRGDIGGRQVAVKRMLAEFYEVASKEVGLLMASDLHPNVVSYYGRKMDAQFVYIALEECACSLASAMTSGMISDMPLELKRKLLFEAASGVAFLHSLGIVHRDVKPQNILLAKDWTAKVADFGLGAELDRGRSSFDTHTAGTLGWLAPEALAGERCTRAVDVFGLGCVAYYVLTNGDHPFGSRYERDWAILNAAPSLDAVASDPARGGHEAVALVSRMVARSRDARITAAQALASPFFWNTRKRLDFLMEASDRVEIDYQDHGAAGRVVRLLEARAADVFDLDLVVRPPRPADSSDRPRSLFTPATPSRADRSSSWRTRDAGPPGFAPSHSPHSSSSPKKKTPSPAAPRRGWMAVLAPELIINLGKYRKYDPRSLRDLLRVMRNKGRHYRDLPPELKAVLGDYPDGYYAYFLRKFPRLLVVVWEVVVEEFGVDADPAFDQYVAKPPPPASSSPAPAPLPVSRSNATPSAP